ncbi:MAG: hypothetical protein IPG63_15265 [Xanthomonadales bacterium]|nr:hypothetical protein [Xanthomonadales bacterium]
MENDRGHLAGQSAAHGRSAGAVGAERLLISLALAFVVVLFWALLFGFFGSGIPWLDVYFPGSGRYHDQALAFVPFARVFLPTLVLSIGLVGVAAARRRSFPAYAGTFAWAVFLGWVLAFFGCVVMTDATTFASVPVGSWLIAAAGSGGWQFAIPCAWTHLALLRRYERDTGVRT